jgi:AraC-like DNA-binding protein
MDLITELLRGLNVAGAVFVDARLSDPWSIAIDITPDDCARYMPRPRSVISYHFVLSGHMVVTTPGQPPTRISEGGVVIFPHNDPHSLSSRIGVPAIPAGDILERVGMAGATRIDHGGGADPTRLVCGFLAGDMDGEPLFAALPRMIHAHIEDGGVRDWVAASALFAASELANGRLASSAIMTRLSETLLIEAIRQFCAANDISGLRLLGATRDPKIGRVLRLIHARPMEPWSIDRLAGEAALSRTAFVRRFTELVGHPPIAYVGGLRLSAAKTMLRDTTRPIAQIAHDLGYGSEAAFSRAFKREAAVAPSHWRLAETALIASG